MSRSLKIFRAVGLTFGELEATACSAFAVFFTFNGSAVTSEESSVSEVLEATRIGHDQCPSQSQQNRTGLSGGSAANYVYPDIVLAQRIRSRERPLDIVLVAQAGKVIIEFSFVNEKFSATRSDTHAGDGTFTPTGSPAEFFGS